MRVFRDAFLVLLVLGCTSLVWVVFGANMESRAHSSSNRMRNHVQSLWGEPLAQAAPSVTLVETNGISHVIAPSRTRLDVTMHSDLRRRGLWWFSLYDVEVHGRWRFTNDLLVESPPGEPATVPASPPPRDGNASLNVTLPSGQTSFDVITFRVNGEDRTTALGGRTPVPIALSIAQGESVEVELVYRARGADRWEYRAGLNGVLRDFEMSITTDFADVDYPQAGLSPSTRARDGRGWRLGWSFHRLLTSQTIGMITPNRVQPGELAASLAFSAPISLLFFFGFLFLMSVLGRIRIHPVNYFFIAGAFLSFHLLFAYVCDHLPVEQAFAIASATSVLLVVSYLRLVVGNRFAFVEAAIAQLVYLVGFALAHFWEGLTGLTITVLGIGSLFVTMQLTGRIRWGEERESAVVSPPRAPPPAPPA